MELCVPTNWQPDLLERLNKKAVREIYGKLESDVVGGAHASILLPPVSKKDAAKHIALVKRHNLGFNYLLNSSCMGNLEWTSQGQRKIRALLDWLTDIGVDAVTVTAPYLLQLIKRSYPHFEVGVSVAAGVDNAIRARYWEDLGADQITLSFVDVNRNFEVLKQIRASVGIRLQLIANLQCIYGCPFYKYHNVLNSHASQENDARNNFYVDYCSLSCRYLRLLEPWRLIAAGWIRPEDLHYYSAIGIDRIKLVDRGMNSDFISKITEAYTSQKYEGNLLDLFPFDIKKYIAFSKNRRWKKIKYFFHPMKANIFHLYRMQSMLLNDDIYLDNQKLDKFLEYFVNGKCNPVDCGKCGYCQKISETALHISMQRQERLKRYESLLDDIISGRVFYIKNKNTIRGK